MKKIALIVNLGKVRSPDVVRRVVEQAVELGLKVVAEGAVSELSDMVEECPVAEFTDRGVEAVVVLGGDGTMLDAAHLLAGQKLPLMGLNIGSLGYLTSVEERDFDQALEQLCAGNYKVGWRSTLAVELRRADGKLCVLPDALNDVVVNHAATSHAVELELALDDERIASFMCDGVIVATPTGSTAYSLSAGGPILLPDVGALVVSLICPHALTSRPLVIRDDARISIRAVECEPPMNLSSDGRGVVPFHLGDVVEVARSSRDVPIIELSDYNACDVLRRKLRWGGR